MKCIDQGIVVVGQRGADRTWLAGRRVDDTFQGLAGAKPASGTSQQDGSHGLVGVDRGKRRPQFCVHLPCKTVELFGAIKGYLGDAADDVEQDGRRSHGVI